MPSAPILKKNRAGFVRSPTYTDPLELYKAACSAYEKIAQTLERNGAPLRILPSSFQDRPEGAFAKMKEAYVTIVDHKPNSPFIMVHANPSPGSEEMDPEFLANTILMQSLHVRAKKESQGRTRAGTIMVTQIMDAAEALAVVPVITPARTLKINFNGLDSERVFIPSEPLFNDDDTEHFTATREYDGHQKFKGLMELLLVERLGPLNHRIYPVSLTNMGIRRFMRTDPDAGTVQKTISALNSAFDRIKAGGCIFFYPSGVKLTFLHAPTVKHIAAQLENILKRMSN